MYGKSDWISAASGTDPYCHLSMPYIDLQSALLCAQAKITQNFCHRAQLTFALLCSRNMLPQLKTAVSLIKK
jgi:hypothetical protein